MIQDHRPYIVKKWFQQFERFYVRHFLMPHFEAFDSGYSVMGPWHVEVFGGPVRIGRCATIIATSDRKVRFSVWSDSPDAGKIVVGDYGLISPGVRISSASEIIIGDNCMIASNAYITDCDWHDIYDRVASGASVPVQLGNNVWIGDSAIVCKGVSIGENSIVGAGAVVTRSIEANVIAAGNPARTVRSLDFENPIATRAHWFSTHPNLKHEMDEWDRAMMKGNTVIKWLRYLISPRRGD
ncbi:MAG TPA: acyltransferase [Desulfatirhabdiaceae bacterium]|nr:acyltransferase [Desulfatirhabdiaceae bacterium]